MIRVIFKTLAGVAWDYDLPVVPRIGEYVELPGMSYKASVRTVTWRVDAKVLEAVVYVQESP